MKIFSIFLIFSFFLLLIEIQTQQNSSSLNQSIEVKDNNNTITKNINETTKNNTLEAKKENTTEDLIEQFTKGIKQEDKERLFNLTESLINFFKETFGGSENNTETESAEEKERKKAEEERLKEEQAKLEKIKIEEKKKKEKEEKYLSERNEFIMMLTNNSFEENVQINLLKGEKETLYIDLEAFSKIKIALMITDSEQEEKLNFFFSGPNSRGRTAVIYQIYGKNYLFWEYETLRKGEFTAEIINKGTKENEIYFLLSVEKDGKKKDRIDVEKLDKISMLLNEIDNNVNQLRNKKKIEIKQVNSHNKKVSENNKWIVYYSIIEIFTMIMVFLFQSCYINSLVNKV